MANRYQANTKSNQEKLHETLTLKNNSLWLDALPSKSTGMAVLPPWLGGCCLPWLQLSEVVPLLAPPSVAIL